MSTELLARVVRGEQLSRSDVLQILDFLCDPAEPDPRKAALLAAWAAKGETTEELASFAIALRERAVPFPGPRAHRAVDLCGSGGAPRPSFNVGTVSTFVIRAAGVPVAKHGNRSLRGKAGGWAGSSDLVEALGLPALESRAFARAAFDRERITFLHAPLYHAGTRAVASVRAQLGIRTIFNLIGPLTNPASVPFQVVGCPDLPTAARIAPVLARMGVRRGLTVASRDGTDEFSSRAMSFTYPVGKGSARRRSVDPRQWLRPEDRRGSLDALPSAAAAQETERILAGGTGARRGSVLLTSGAALWVRGDAPSLRAGIDRAQEALDSGAAEEVLARLRDLAASRSWPKEGP